MENDFCIRFLWDEDAHVWIAETNDVPGLVLESESLDNLTEHVKFAVPELYELNCAAYQPGSINKKK